ncbi:hypothetical protein [Hoeflea prorocentri]|uniref:Uncharacterized protein n=1 Tax=Hoeflea prorocentri TaxID=1922333 RepID=A0A9X3ZHR3_9HYPH|nr:hypothetical protein [Hoeflea prorocentri]MCY6381629.1 hypothetical protein [Hoeflea prorocentri]MDA5399429.1 hypothetical protein [Hoeflea prorocentri]
MCSNAVLSNVQRRDIDAVLHPYAPQHKLRETGALDDTGAMVRKDALPGQAERHRRLGKTRPAA